MLIFGILQYRILVVACEKNLTELLELFFDFLAREEPKILSEKISSFDLPMLEILMSCAFFVKYASFLTMKNWRLILQKSFSYLLRIFFRCDNREIFLMECIRSQLEPEYFVKFVLKLKSPEYAFCKNAKISVKNKNINKISEKILIHYQKFRN